MELSEALHPLAAATTELHSSPAAVAPAPAGVTEVVAYTGPGFRASISRTLDLSHRPIPRRSIAAANRVPFTDVVPKRMPDSRSRNPSTPKTVRARLTAAARDRPGCDNCQAVAIVVAAFTCTMYRRGLMSMSARIRPRQGFPLTVPPCVSTMTNRGNSACETSRKNSPFKPVRATGTSVWTPRLVTMRTVASTTGAPGPTWAQPNSNGGFAADTSATCTAGLLSIAGRRSEPGLA